MTTLMLDPFPPEDDDDLCGLGDLAKDVGALARQMGAILDVQRRIAAGIADPGDLRLLGLLKRANTIICDRYARSAPLAGDTPAAVAAPGSFAADRRRRRLRRGDRPKILKLSRPKTTPSRRPATRLTMDEDARMLDHFAIEDGFEALESKLETVNKTIAPGVAALSAIADRLQPKEFDLTAFAAQLMAVLVGNAYGEMEDSDFAAFALDAVTGAIALRDALAAHTKKPTAVVEVSTATQNKSNACCGAGEPNCFSASNDPLQAQPPRDLRESEAV